MKLAIQKRLVLIIVALSCSISTWGADGLQGLRFQGTPQPLPGSFLFLVGLRGDAATDTVNSACIYEYNLASNALQKVVDAPPGDFICSRDGNLLCVIFGNSDRIFTGTNAFLFSRLDSTSHTVSLGKRPNQWLVLERHAFFVLDASNGSMLAHYDFARNILKRIEVQERRGWGYETYDSLHRATGQTDTVHFEYRGSGLRLRQDGFVKKGFYSYDAQTGNITNLASRCWNDNEAHNWQSADGRYVFMRGIDEPLHGNDLVSSSFPFLEWSVWNRGQSDTKVLKHFRKARKGYSTFEQLSPCRRYALVKLTEAVQPLIDKPWMRYTFIVVNIATGATYNILEDTVESYWGRFDEGPFVSGITWVDRSQR